MCLDVVRQREQPEPRKGLGRLMEKGLQVPTVAKTGLGVVLIDNVCETWVWCKGW